MSGGATGEIARHLRQLFGEGTLAGLTDAQLLDRFRTGGDALAFTAIVARHGPMVRDVCHSVLRDPADADDAFQAAFLVLARRAGTVRSRAGVGGWLHRVARRIAVRAATARRERPHADAVAIPGSLGPGPGPVTDADPDADPARAAARRELRGLVHEELARLPEPYRAVIQLCDLEGLSHDDAARRLRWPVGTVKGRLARGRDRLRDRLRRRGIDGPAPALAVGSTAVNEALLGRTVALASGAAGAVPAGVAVLVAEALRSMFWTNLKLGTLAAVALALLAGGVAALGGGPPEGDAPAAALAARPATPAPAPVPEAEADDERERLAGERADLELLEIELEAQKAALADLAGTLARRAVATPRAEDEPDLSRTYDRQKAAYRERAVELERRKNRLATASGPRVLRPGDLLLIEVLEALPGRPITGRRVVRPDGTITLDFYGDLAVAGLTRQQVKEKVVRHLTKFLNDEVLGLEGIDPDTGKPVAIPPAESDRVFVDDSLNDLPADAPPEDAFRRRPDPTARRLSDVEEKLNQVLRRLPPEPAKPRPDAR
jgi:RNA polymerase sigma factor (sigma-70 family)